MINPSNVGRGRGGKKEEGKKKKKGEEGRTKAVSYFLFFA